MIDIDGLRRDVFLRALQTGEAPTLARLVGGAEARHGLHLEPVSTAPSITFCCQSSIFTGEHPERHGIVGNQFFDRFGTLTHGVPRFYAFDVGDTLAMDDAVAVFSGPSGLLNEILSPEARTLYQRAAERGLTSVVAHNMVARGATHWLRPGVVNLARFMKGGWLISLSSEEFDGRMVDALRSHLQLSMPPDVLTAYFMGLDHESHVYGPQAQYEYLTRVVDRQVAALVGELERRDLLAETLFVVLSDHGQIAVPADDHHSLRLSFPFDREMGALFDALGLDVHDLPGEDPACDAVVASNGGMAHVYLQHRQGRWADRPRFNEDVLPVARALWEANLTGRYAPDLCGALALILVRDVEHEGWEADYRALANDGQLIALADYLAAHPEIEAVDAVNRLRHLASPVGGDLVLVSDYGAGFYFGAPLNGMHGGLHPDDSEAVLSLGWPGGAAEDLAALRRAVAGDVHARCQREGDRRVGIVDTITAVSAALRW